MQRFFLHLLAFIVPLVFSLPMDLAQKAALTAPASVGNAVPANTPGNSANLGWVLEGAQGEIYIGTEHGLFRMEQDERMYAYAPHNAYGLTGCGEHLVYCRDDGLYAFDVTPASQPYPTAWLFDGHIGRTAVMSGYLYFNAGTALYRIDVRDPSGLDAGGGAAKPELLIEGADPYGEGFSFAFNGRWAAGSDRLLYQISRDGYRRESRWLPYPLGGQSAAGDLLLMDTDLQSPFIADGWLYFIPHVSYGSEAPWTDPEPGVYRMALDAEPAWMHESAPDFPAECLARGNVRSFTLAGDTLVCAGDLGEGPGLYTVHLPTGRRAKLYEGDVWAPNTTSDCIWFRTKPQAGADAADAPQYHYWRIRFDGSAPTQLDDRF